MAEQHPWQQHCNPGSSIHGSSIHGSLAAVPGCSLISRPALHTGLQRILQSSPYCCALPVMMCCELATDTQTTAAAAAADTRTAAAAAGVHVLPAFPSPSDISRAGSVHVSAGEADGCPVSHRGKDSVTRGC